MKGAIGNRTASAAGKASKGSRVSTAAKKAAGSDLGQTRKGRRPAATLTGRDFDARLEAAHARIDGVLSRLG